jgi:Domain of unknown function (DUF4186)
MTEPPPLKITCTASECAEDLHCFRPRSWKKPDPHPRCRDCGADLIEWERLHLRDPRDTDFLFSQLPKELVRHHFWHCEIPARVRAGAERYSREVIARRTRAALRSRVAAPAGEWDGTQTAMDPGKGAQIYHFGMHASACCCRKCMLYWHGIPQERALSDEELDYFSTLVWLYVCRRLGWPGEEGLIADVD